tara:strand:- start:267 stop:599 length:333 start_codon:yes stop_codon:yes gene_type:complete
MEFRNLARNVNGSINGDWIQGDDSVIRYTLDPALGHITKAEAGEWGDIEELDPAGKDAHEQAEARAAINQEAMAYLKATDWYVLRAMDSGESVPNDIRLARADARERIAT